MTVKRYLNACMCVCVCVLDFAALVMVTWLPHGGGGGGGRKLYFTS